MGQMLLSEPESAPPSVTRAVPGDRDTAVLVGRWDEGISWVGLQGG